MIELLSRVTTLKKLEQYLQNTGETAGFCYLRGRRRVGKSTLLLHFQKTNPKSVFYFMGRVDEKATQTLRRCSESWDAFTQTKNLTKLKSTSLNWDEFFKAVAMLGATLKNPVLLAFDEVQWIGREQSGFLGALKEHWVNLERLSHLRILLCGSSNRFFQQMTGGEEKLIRGLKTRADIWLQPFSLAEVKSHYQAPFSDQEFLLAYSFFGGIPYYWNQIDTKLFFIQCMNRACFIPSSLFLEEYMEMLNLEFQKNAIHNLDLILAQIQGNGVPAATIAEKARLSHSTVGDLLQKLENYNLVFRKTPLFSKPKEIQRGALYYIKDFYLNFYFSILRKNRRKILRNKTESILFASMLDASQKQLYIQNYTGPMFERLVQYILECSEERNEKIFRKLHLENLNFEVGFHWDKTHQFDLIVQSNEDRVYRFLECKWTKDSAQILQAIRIFKERVQGFDFPIQKVLCLNHEPGKAICEVAKKNDVCIVTPQDLI